jgi:hypothetical protein
MTVMGKNIPVTYLINPVKFFRSKIERNIDDAIEKKWILNLMY